MDLETIFQERFRKVYAEEHKAAGSHFTNAEEMGEFFNDGVAMLSWIKKNRNKLFTIRKMKLLGIELPLLLCIAKDIYYKAFIDFALYDEELNKVYIYDIKTSTRGWSDSEKETIKKLLKSYYTKNTSLDNMDGTSSKSKSNSSSLSAKSMNKLNTLFPGFSHSNPLVEKPNEDKH